MNNGNSGDMAHGALVRITAIAAQWVILRRWETIASVRAPDRDCPDVQRLPIRMRPGDRPPVQRS